MEKLESITIRNLRVIDLIPLNNETRLKSNFARLCLDLIKPNSPDEPLNKENINLINQFSLSVRPYIFRIIMRIAFKRKFVRLFTLIASEFYSIEAYFLKYPFKNQDFEFIQSLPSSLSNKILVNSEIDMIRNDYERLASRLEMGFCHEEIKSEIIWLFENSNDEFFISKLIKKVINFSEDPARKIHFILSSIKDHELLQNNIRSISHQLENQKYIKSLLRPENVDKVKLFSFQLKESQSNFSLNSHKKIELIVSPLY